MTSARDTQALTLALKEAARAIGFDLAGICPAVEPPGISRFREWLASGYAGEMRYLSERAAAYEHPRAVLDGVRSIVMLAVNYQSVASRPTGPGQGRVSRYAWGPSDYHDMLHDKLQRLAETFRGWQPQARCRGVVDTAPLLEREFAQLAGLGWIGKNTLLLNRSWGSWFFLAALLTDQELEYDASHEANHCGTCRACLDACPTSAFPEPYVLDATKCISYLTIELRGALPHVLREGVGDWLFGCDVCQDVCPWNQRVPPTSEPAFQPRPDQNPVDLCALFELSDESFRQRFRSTPLWRPKRRGLLRNAAIVLGNQRTVTALPTLQRGLHDAEPLVRGACAWALGRLGGAPARAALQGRLPMETDNEVRGEIVLALESGEQRTEGGEPKEIRNSRLNPDNSSAVER